MNVVVKTKKGMVNVLLVGDEVFISLKSIAGLKGIDVQDVEAEIVSQCEHNPEHNVQAQHAKTLLEQTNGQLDAVNEQNQSKRIQRDTLKRNMKTVKDAGQKVQYQAELRNVETSLSEGEREAKALQLRADNLAESIKDLKVFDGTIDYNKLATVLV